MNMAVFETGPAATNGYLVCDRPGGVAAVIDAPLDSADLLWKQACEWKVKVEWLINTHGHWDHVLDNAAFQRLSGAKFAIHRDSEPLLRLPQTRMFGLDLDIEPVTVDLYLGEPQILTVGGLRFEMLDCPGHCPGSVVLYERSEKTAFVGDVVFAGSMGRTDLPGGDTELLLTMIGSKILALADDVRLLPGHGPATTVGQERRFNPYLQGIRRGASPKSQ